MTTQGYAAARPGRAKRRGGAVTFWVGVVVTVVAVLVAALLGWRTYDEVRTIIDEAEPVEGPTTVTLQQGQAREIYQVEDGGQRAECTVTGPDGQAVRVQRTRTVEGSTGEEAYVNVGGFTADRSGDYVIECTGPPTFVGPQLNLAATVGSVIGVIGGILGLVLGLVLILVGAVLWFVGRSEDSKAALSPPGDHATYGPGIGPRPPPQG